MPLELIRSIRAIRRRLQWIEFCRKTLKTLSWLSAAMLVYVVASKLVSLVWSPEMILPWVAGAGLVWIVSWAWLRRIRLFEAAIRADEALGLKERLSSALLIRQPPSEAELAVLQDAARCAAEIRPRRNFRANLGREIKWATAPLLALILVWNFMPPFDLFAKRAEKKAETIAMTAEAKKEAAKELETLAKEVAAENSPLKQSDLAKQVEREMKALAKDLEEQKIDRDEAMAKMAKLSDKLADRQEELKKKLEKAGELQSLGEGKMTKELSKSLEKGNFSKASEKMEEIKKKLQDGKLSDEEKAALQKELKALSEKLGKDSKLGEALSKAAESLEKGDMAEALDKMEMAEGEMMDMEAALNEFKAMESLKYDMEARNRAMSGKGECKSCGKAMSQDKDGLCSECEGHGEWKAGETDKYGNGMGGPGKGRGSIAEKEEGPAAFDKSRVKGDLAPGKIIAKMKVSGQQTAGEVTTQYEEMRLEYAQKAEDTIHTEPLPMEYKSLVRDYFDAIKGSKDQAAGAPSQGVQTPSNDSKAEEPATTKP